MLKSSSALINSTGAIIAIVLLVVGVGVGYFVGGAGAPATPITAIQTTTETKTVGPGETVTVTSTSTSTTTNTATRTVTKPTTITTTKTAEPTAPPAKYKDTITIGTVERIKTGLDPANAVGWMAVNTILNVGAGLVRYEPGTSDVIPDLATGWTISGDGKTYTFSLRDDAKFSNGNQVTAKTFEFSWRRALTLKGPPTFFLGLVVEGPDSVRAVDDYTFEVNLMHPFAPFLSLVAISAAPTYPVDPSVVSADEFDEGVYIGAGPYQITNYVRDVSMMLTPNPHYFGEKPRTEKVVIETLSDSSALALSLRTKEIDMTLRGGISPSDVATFEENPEFEVREPPVAFLRMLNLNTQLPPFDDVRTRRAVAAAIDRAEIVDTVFQGKVKELYTIVPRGIPGGISYFKTIYGDRNLEESKRLLGEAGYSSSNKMRMDLYYDVTQYGNMEKNVATVLKLQIERTGMVDVVLNPVESAKLSSLVVFVEKPGTVPSWLYGWWADYLDPDDYLYSFYGAFFSGILCIWVEDENMENLLNKERALVDFESRLPILAEIQELGAELATTIPLWQINHQALTVKGVEGIALGASILVDYRNLAVPD